MKFLKENFKVYLWISIISLLFFASFIIFNKGVIIFFGDSYEQVYQLYIGLWQRINNGGFNAFDFSLGFGSNIFSLAFYILFNPFAYLVTFLKLEHIKYIFLVLYWLQFVLTFVSSSLWLSRIVKHNYSWIIGSLMLTFSGWIVFYMQYDLFFRSFMFYSLILYFVERYLKDNSKIIGLVLSIGILGITNYFLLYQFIPYLFLYTLFRYLIINKNNLRAKTIILEALKFVGFTFLGIGVSCIVLLPCAAIVFNMSRFSETSLSGLSFISFKQLYNIYTSILTPVISILDANGFISSGNYESLGWGGGAPLYCLSICLPLVSTLIHLPDKFTKRSYSILLLIIICFSCVINFYTLFNLSLDSRWFYMFIFTFVLIACVVCDALIDKTIPINKFKINCIAIVIIYIICNLISYYLKLNSVENLKLVVIVSSLIILFILLYYYCFKKNNYRLILIILSVEIIGSGQLFYACNKPVNYKAFNQPIMNFDVNDYLSQINDSQFYRVLYDSSIYLDSIDEANNVSLIGSNHPFAQNYNGFSFYLSLYNYEMENYINRFKSTWNMNQNRTRIYSYTPMGARYFVTYDYINEVPFGYDFVTTFENGLSIFENKYAMPIGYTYSKTINEDAVLSLPYFMQDIVMANYLVTQDSLNYSYDIDEPSHLITFTDSSYREYWFEEPITNTQLIIENFGIPSITVQTYYQDELIREYPQYWQFNYVDIVIEEQPIDKIVILGEDTYGYGTQINLYSYDINNYIDDMTDLNTNTFTNIDYSNDHIEADITISSDNEFIFTSIPYDLGWKLYANGEPVAYEKVQMGFIGFKLPVGEYHIVFNYSLPGLVEGSFVSIVSLIVLALASAGIKKQKH